MDDQTTTMSGSFEEFWEETAHTRKNFPEDITQVLKRYMRYAWISAIQSAGNRVYCTFENYGVNPDTTDIAQAIHAVIWSMKAKGD